MSGHSKWHNIAHKKGIADSKRGKIFTVHAKMIALAARAGGDPEMNAALRSAIDRAKADNVPNANIERAIKKGTGEDKDGTIYEFVTYEAFGPEGVVFLIDCITDNKNRTLTNIRIALQKVGGNLGSAGTVSWKFDKKAYFLVDPKGKKGDDVELAIIDAGADDLAWDGDKVEVYSSPDQLAQVKSAMQAAGFDVEKDDLIWKAKEVMMLSDVEVAKKVSAIMERIDEDDDVQQVYTNAEFTDEVMGQL